MKTMKIEELPFGGRTIRVTFDEDQKVEQICINDICSVIRRDRLIQTGEIKMICPNATPLKSETSTGILLFAPPSDVRELCRIVRKDSGMSAILCDKVLKWLDEVSLPEEQDEVPEVVTTTKSSLELKYKDHVIAFKIFSNRLFVSATHLCKVKDQPTVKWLRRAETITLQEELIRKGEFPDIESQVRTTRGKYGSTWIDHMLGEELTLWLSLELHEWYMGRLQSLMPEKYGVPQKIRKKEEPKIKEFEMPQTLEEAQAMIQRLVDEAVENEPKVEFYYEFVDNREFFKSTRIADELETSPHKMHQFLKDRGIIVYEKKQWVVTPQYSSLQDEIPYLWTNPEGKTYAFGKVRRWTPTGREYILNLYQEENDN